MRRLNGKDRLQANIVNDTIVEDEQELPVRQGSQKYIDKFNKLSESEKKVIQNDFQNIISQLMEFQTIRSNSTYQNLQTKVKKSVKNAMNQKKHRVNINLQSNSSLNKVDSNQSLNRICISNGKTFMIQDLSETNQIYTSIMQEQYQNHDHQDQNYKNSSIDIIQMKKTKTNKISYLNDFRVIDSVYNGSYINMRDSINSGKYSISEQSNTNLNQHFNKGFKDPLHLEIRKVNHFRMWTEFNPEYKK